MISTESKPCALVVFQTALGWMAMVGSGSALEYLTFGHRSAKRARAAIPQHLARRAESAQWNPSLRARLEAYALGDRVDFRDVPIELPPCGPFRTLVLHCCRQIDYGQTCTYGQLAAWAGYPGAARAVGNCMAANPIPLVIPCHRVLAADGSLGGFSAPGGVCLKRRLLDLEAGCFRA